MRRHAISNYGSPTRPGAQHIISVCLLLDSYLQLSITVVSLLTVIFIAENLIVWILWGCKALKAVKADF